MNREVLKKRVVNILKNHVGKENVISARMLYCMATNDPIIPAKERNQTRILRSIIRELRERRELAVMSGNGYWVAESDAELREYVERSLIEAKRRIKLSSQLSGIPIDRMVEQLKMKLNKQESHNEQAIQH